MKIFGKEFKFNNHKVYHAGDKPTPYEIGAANTNHTHNYAGSSSAGGSANSAIKLATARTINGTSFDGTVNISIGVNNTNEGPRKDAETGTNRIQYPGVSMNMVYNNKGYPLSYGNVLNVRGEGENQILLGWSQTSTTTVGHHEKIFVRNKRDSGNAWSDWAQVYTTAHKPSLSELGNYIEGDGMRMGKGMYGSTDIGISGNHNGGSVSIGASSVWLKSNNYYDGQGDKFMSNQSVACQLALQIGAAAGPTVRWSTNTPTSGGNITWGDTYYLVTTKGGQTMNGDLWLDTYGGERAFKANHNWGMYMNRNGVGWYDWANGRGVLAYEVDNNRIVATRRFIAAGGTYSLLSESAFTAKVSSTSLFNRMAIDRSKYNLDNYEIISSDNGPFILNKEEAVKQTFLNRSSLETEVKPEEEQIVSTNLEHFYITLVNEIKTLKEELRQLKEDNIIKQSNNL